MVGRCLGTHGFIFDVLYSSELVDSSKEIFKVRKPITSFASSASYSGNCEKDNTLPVGVYTLVSNCYSYTCKEGSSCYSNFCPRKTDLETLVERTQFKNLVEESVLEEKLWFKIVPEEILEAVSSAERKRQEILFEIIQTERQFLDDLQTVQNVFIKPLLETDIIEASQRQIFVETVFLNMNEIYQTNSKLKRKLLSRQRENFVINAIGDIFASIAEEWYVFVEYGAGQAYAKYLVDEEKANNPKFLAFLKVFLNSIMSRNVKRRRNVENCHWRAFSLVRQLEWVDILSF